MEQRNTNSLIEKISRTVEKHKLEEGVYARWLWQNAAGTRKTGMNEYGCADAANILYTIGEFEGDPEKRLKWIAALQSMQDSETGMYTEATHHTIHTTAHCTAALELFDAKPSFPLKELFPYLEKKICMRFWTGWTGTSIRGPIPTGAPAYMPR